MNKQETEQFPLKLLPKFACLSNSLNIYNRYLRYLPIIKQSAPLSLHFPVQFQLRFFFPNESLLVTVFEFFKGHSENTQS